MEHEEAEIRAASVRASWILEPQRDTLEELARSECPCIRISAIAGLLVHGWLDAEVSAPALEAALEDPETHTRMALAHAIRLRYCETFRAAVLALSRDADATIRAEAIAAIRVSEDPYYTPHLVSLLDDRSIREEVRTALRERGDDALTQLERAFERTSQTPVAIAHHVPRTISSFGTRRAAEILLRHLNFADGGGVRYKILRGLATLFTDPNCRGLDEAPLLEAIQVALSRTHRLVYWHAELERAHREEPARRTPTGELLAELLFDKERLALERLVRLAYLRRPDEDFQHVWSGLRSTTPKTRASSLELLAGLLEPEVSRAVIPLLDRGSHPNPLAAAQSPLAVQHLAYPELLWVLADDASRSLRGIALYHIAELELVRPSEVRDEEPANAVARLRSRALALLERLPYASTAGPTQAGLERPADA